MSAIGPGDWVQFIMPYSRSGKLTPGALYCVEAMDPEPFAAGCWCHGHDAGSIGIALVGVPGGRIWCHLAFAPVYRPKTSIIEALKQPSPELEDA